MIIPVGSLVYIRTFNDVDDSLCVIISKGRPEFIGVTNGAYYYEVYCFKSKLMFLCFDYEMVLLPTDK